MFGGPGADRFWFDDGDTGLGAANRDRISDFLRSQGDKLNVELIDANLNVAGDQDFVFRGTAAFTGIGQIRVVASGADRIIQGNNDSDMQADFEIILVGFNTAVLGRRLQRPLSQLTDRGDLQWPSSTARTQR